MRIALVALIGCGPAAPAEPTKCPWHAERAGSRRCALGDPLCGPDTLYDCLDAMHYDASASRRPVEGIAPSPGCVDDGMCAVVRGCGPFRCETIQPPRPRPPPGTPVIDEPVYTCGLDLEQERLFRTRFCGCVKHSCAWFTQ